MSEINISYSKNEYLWELVDENDLPEGSQEKNKQKIDELHELTNKHSGSDERYENTMKIYNRHILDLFNITAGIAVCGVFIYYSYTKKPGFI